MSKSHYQLERCGGRDGGGGMEVDGSAEVEGLAELEGIVSHYSV